MQLLQDTSRININKLNSVKTHKKSYRIQAILTYMNSAQALKTVFISNNKKGIFEKLNS